MRYEKCLLGSLIGGDRKRLPVKCSLEQKQQMLLFSVAHTEKKTTTSWHMILALLCLSPKFGVLIATGAPTGIAVSKQAVSSLNWSWLAKTETQPWLRRATLIGSVCVISVSSRTSLWAGAEGCWYCCRYCVIPGDAVEGTQFPVTLAPV